MKRSIALFVVFLSVFSCEDVIDVPLNTAEPKLVIEASINWFKDTTGNEQQVKLSLTAPYFDTEIPPANGALVNIFDSNNNSFEFVEDGNTGIYKCNNFVPQLNETYILTISYNGENYSAEETLKSVAPIDYIEQNNEGGFSGTDIELKAYYTDPPDAENFYFFEFISDIVAVPVLDVYDDEFTNGNQIFGFYTEEDLESGDMVTIRNYGISERFYNYMFVILQQSSEGGGGPFEPQPTVVRGNCVNLTNSDNFPLGYFRLSEVDEVIYTVE